MSIFRNMLLLASENKWMCSHVPNWKFVKMGVKKFMPGEETGDAFAAAEILSHDSIPVVFTYLGENITRPSDGDSVLNHYLDLIEKIAKDKSNIEISLKLTQLGLNLSNDDAYNRLKSIAAKTHEKSDGLLWIDMEGSDYTTRTIELYKRLKTEFDNIGLCLQAYLFRTENDLKKLLPLNPNIRLVKGAYKEPGTVAFAEKKDVDTNYLFLAKLLLKNFEGSRRIAFATHDAKLCSQILRESIHYSVNKNNFEFQMLYGINSHLQKDLIERRCNVRILISYGNFWYPWYMRRLAERPANVWFALKYIFR